jgi:hypothetical protein
MTIPQHVQEAANSIAGLLDQIAEHFDDGAKLTLIVRFPDTPDGSADLVETTDDPAQAAKAVIRMLANQRRTEGTAHG